MKLDPHKIKLPIRTTVLQSKEDPVLYEPAYLSDSKAFVVKGEKKFEEMKEAQSAANTLHYRLENKHSFIYEEEFELVEIDSDKPKEELKS
jgi:hypothetical protein